MAWWDLVGQTLGRTAARALGRALRRRLRAARRACRWRPTRGSASPMPRAATPSRSRAGRSSRPQQVAEGFTTLKLSMTSYEPDDHVELVARIREAVPARDRHPRGRARHLERVEARRIMRALEPYRVSVYRAAARLAPAATLLRRAARARARRAAFQREYYFRKLEELRRDTALRSPATGGRRRSCSPRACRAAPTPGSSTGI